MILNKIKFSLGISRNPLLDLFHNPKTRRIYSHMIIVDEGDEENNIKINDIKYK